VRGIKPGLVRRRYTTAISFGAFGAALSVVSASLVISTHPSLIGCIGLIKCHLESPSLEALVNDLYFLADPQVGGAVASLRSFVVGATRWLEELPPMIHTEPCDSAIMYYQFGPELAKTCANRYTVLELFLIIG